MQHDLQSFPTRRSSDLKSINPATEEMIAPIAKSGAEDVAAAVEAAKKAYDGWRLTPAPRRGEILYRVGQLLVRSEEHTSELQSLTNLVCRLLLEKKKKD